MAKTIAWPHLLQAGEQIKSLRDALRDLLDRDYRNTCTHEDTHRGGAIWEICDQCGMRWADDEGGRPEWVDPPEWGRAEEALALTAPDADGSDGWRSSDTAPDDGSEFQGLVGTGVGRSWWEPRCKIEGGRLGIWGRVDYDEDGWDFSLSQCALLAWQPQPNIPPPADTEGQSFAESLQPPCPICSGSPADQSEQEQPDGWRPPNTLVKEIESVVNRYSAENGSDTPDFILASFLLRSLESFDAAVNRREEWYGRKTKPAPPEGEG